MFRSLSKISVGTYLTRNDVNIKTRPDENNNHPDQFVNLLLLASENKKIIKLHFTLKFVSFSVKISSGVSPSWSESTVKMYLPKVSCWHSTTPLFLWTNLGFFVQLPGFESRVHASWSQPQLHVFLNQRVGKTCTRAVLGPRLATVILIRTSLGVFLEYSAKMSQ